jgi:glutamate racemase
MIGIFDSSLGGLLLARELRQQLPAYDFLFFGDIKSGPYDNNSIEAAIRQVEHYGRFLADRGVQVLMLACPVTSYGDNPELDNTIGLPVINLLSSTASEALPQSSKKRFGIMGPRSSVGWGMWETVFSQISPGARVDTVAAPLLASLLEEGLIHRPETTMILKKYLQPLKVRKIDTLILADCHYCVLQKRIQKKMGRNVVVVEAASAMVSHLIRFLGSHPHIDGLLSKARCSHFWVNDSTPEILSVSRKLYGSHLQLELVNQTLR